MEARTSQNAANKPSALSCILKNLLIPKHIMEPVNNNVEHRSIIIMVPIMNKNLLLGLFKFYCFAYSFCSYICYAIKMFFYKNSTCQYKSLQSCKAHKFHIPFRSSQIYTAGINTTLTVLLRIKCYNLVFVCFINNYFETKEAHYA